MFYFFSSYQITPSSPNRATCCRRKFSWRWALLDLTMESLREQIPAEQKSGGADHSQFPAPWKLTAWSFGPASDPLIYGILLAFLAHPLDRMDSGPHMTPGQSTTLFLLVSMLVSCPCGCTAGTGQYHGYSTQAKSQYRTSCKVQKYIACTDAVRSTYSPITTLFPSFTCDNGRHQNTRKKRSLSL